MSYLLFYKNETGFILPCIYMPYSIQVYTARLP